MFNREMKDLTKKQKKDYKIQQKEEKERIKKNKLIKDKSERLIVEKDVAFYGVILLPTNNYKSVPVLQRKTGYTLITSILGMDVNGLNNMNDFEFVYNTPLYLYFLQQKYAYIDYLSVPTDLTNKIHQIETRKEQEIQKEDKDRIKLKIFDEQQRLYKVLHDKRISMKLPFLFTDFESENELEKILDSLFYALDKFSPKMLSEENLISLIKFNNQSGISIDSFDLFES